ncbi:MAG: hypothetical protein ACK5HY_12340 [Parahaliea sp.]
MPPSEALPQSLLMAQLLPLLRETGHRYRKFQPVHARPAVSGEEDISITADGEETRNRAGSDHMVVKNLTGAGECYVMGRERFAARYRQVAAVDDDWRRYEPLGEILALEITPEMRVQFGVARDFLIEAPWGSEQTAREGDILASPWPELDQVYRIARREFGETYRSLAKQ